MPEIHLDLDRLGRWLDWFRKGEFGTALQSGCQITINRTGQSRACLKLRPANGAAGSVATLVEGLRSDPGHSLTAQHDSALSGLASPWFSALESVAALTVDDEIHLCGNGESEPWFSGLPWELAAIRTKPGMAGRLADLPFTRRLRGSRAYAPVPGPRLRILTCISVDAADGVDVGLFLEEMHTSLRDRTASMEWESVSAGGNPATYSQLEAKITAWRPHVVVLVCHGRIQADEPELQFEDWRRMRHFADVLAANGHAMTVVLLACDQAVLVRTRDQRSGAVVLLAAGVPSVVAMQNKIRADCAAWFMAGFLDGLLVDGRVTHAARLGRRQIASHLPADEFQTSLDWAFPALFLNDGGVPALATLADRPRDIARQLEATMRKISPPRFDFSRQADAWHWDSPAGLHNRFGLFAVSGAPGVGKTHWIRKHCREHISRQVVRLTADLRRILYVDFERTETTATGLPGLYEIVRRQAAECSPAGVTWEPWFWPTLSAAQPLSHLTEIIDANRMVLVLDGPDNALDDLPPAWADAFSGLNHSVVIIAADTAPAGSAGLILGSLTQEETEGYWMLCGGTAAEAHEVWLQTGGLIRAVEHRWLAGPDTNAVDGHSHADWVLAGLEPAQRRLLFMLCVLPDGINLALLHARLGSPGDVRVLERKGILLHEYRKECPSPFVRLPLALIDILAEIQPDELDHADNDLIAAVNASLSRWPGNEAEQLVALVDTPGGLDLLLALQSALARMGSFAALGILATALEPYLSRRGNWLALLRLWRNAALVAEEAPLTTDQLISYGWCRLYTGDATGAGECLAQADALAEAGQQPARHRLLRAAWLKQTGRREEEALILAIYAEIILAGEPAEASAAERKQTALARYNRSLIHRHWRGDLPAALTDLATARDIFNALGDPVQVAMALCQEVEVRLGSAANAQDFATMLASLTAASTQLAHTEDYAGQAFASYQLARLYRQQSQAVPGLRPALLPKAQEAYARARDLAAGHHLILERCAGELHVVELGLELGNVPAATADERLARTITLLQLARGDAWALRLRRDAWMLRARLAATSVGAIDAWRQAFACAIVPPCHPAYGTDRIRAAHALRELALRLTAEGRVLELDELLVTHQLLIENLVGHAFSFNGANHQDWIAALPQP